MVLSFLLTSAHFWRLNQKWRYVTSRRRIFSKLRQTVPFYDILLRSKFEVNLMFQTEIMAICVHSSSKHVFWHFLTFCRKMHEIWHINSHNFRSTHSVKLVDPSLELYLVVLSFKILTLMTSSLIEFFYEKWRHWFSPVGAVLNFPIMMMTWNFYMIYLIFNFNLWQSFRSFTLSNQDLQINL